MLGYRKCSKCWGNAKNHAIYRHDHPCRSGNITAVNGLGMEYRQPCKAYQETGKCLHTWYEHKSYWLCDVHWLNSAPLTIDGVRCRHFRPVSLDGMEWRMFVTEDGREWYGAIDGIHYPWPPPQEHSEPEPPEQGGLERGSMQETGRPWGTLPK